MTTPVHLVPKPAAIEPATDGLWTVEDVCDYLQVRKTFVYRHLDEIRHAKVGKLIRFRQSDVDAWVADKTRGGLKGRR